MAEFAANFDSVRVHNSESADTNIEPVIVCVPLKLFEPVVAKLPVIPFNNPMVVVLVVMLVFS